LELVNISYDRNGTLTRLFRNNISITAFVSVNLLTMNITL